MSQYTHVKTKEERDNLYNYIYDNFQAINNIEILYPNDSIKNINYI